MKHLYIALVSLFCLLSCNTKQTTTFKIEAGVSQSLAMARQMQLTHVTYHLSFALPAKKADTIPAQLTLQFTTTNLDLPVVLDFNADAHKLKTLVVNGAEQPIVFKNEHIIIPTSVLKLGKNTVAIAFTAGELSLNRNDDYLYTLLVPDRASTVFPCFDQPDIKAIYHLTLTAPQNWKVLSAAPVAQKITEQGKTKYTFAPSDNICTYLFSFVAGKFNEASGDSGLEKFSKIHLLYRENDSTKIKASLPEIFRLHREAISFLENYTNHPFPFQKLDAAAIPGFQYGGMEHVGAIQYKESSLFLDESATQNQLLGRGKLIAHETSHMWFGDLVSIKWFNDVWMKEVFANFMADKIANPSFPDINHELQFLITHYPSAYSVDRTQGAHPIRQHLENLKNAGTLYGAIIYNKAPIMMRQLEAIMGKAAFKKGIQTYIKTYQNSNANWNDLVTILDKQTPVNIKQWSSIWVNKSGRPIITDSIVYGDKNTIKNFTLSQHAEDGSTKIWPQLFKIGLVYPQGIKVLKVALLDKTLEVPDAEGLPKPESIIYNYDGFGYGVFPLPTAQLDNLMHIDDVVARGAIYLNLYENTLNGTISPSKTLAVLTKAVLTEKEEGLVKLTSNELSGLFWGYFTAEERKALLPSLEKTLRNKLYQPTTAGIKKTLFNVYENIAYNEKGTSFLYQIWNKTITLPDLKLNQDDYTSLACTLSIYDPQKANDILAKAEGAITNPDKLKRFQFLLPALSNDVAVRDAFFNSLKEEKNREKESWVQSAVGYLNHPLRQETSQKYLAESLALLQEIQRTGDIFFPKRWLDNTIGQYHSAYAKEVVDHFFETHPDYSPVLKNKILQAADGIYRAQKIVKP
ncbi:M1 family metallopeptidase [Zhouia sp. PK063]|uniref:M1 family metallopeptidase n=1 Tax=Zhouia sp. PK063 TaxID=3373602 RepID=UPI0037AC00BB